MKIDSYRSGVRCFQGDSPRFYRVNSVYPSVFDAFTFIQQPQLGYITKINPLVRVFHA